MLRLFALTVLLISGSEAQAWFLSPSTTGGEHMVKAAEFRAAGQAKKAIQSYMKAAQKPETRVDATVALGQYYLELGDHKRAIKLFESYTDAENPWPAEARMTLVEAYIRAGKFAPAIHQLDDLNTLRPGYLPAAEARGVVFYYSKRFDDAIANFSAFLKTNPDHFRARWHRGLAYYKLERWDQAAADFKYLAEKNPKDPDVWENLGESYFKGNRLEDARKALLVRIDLAPTAGAYDLLGQVREKQGVLTDAAASYSKALEADPKRMEAGLRLAKVYLRMKQFAKAEEELRREFEVNPGFDAGVQELVTFYWDLGRQDMVGNYLRQYTKKFPERTWAAYRYVRQLVSIKEYGKAHDVVDRHESANPKHVAKIDTALMRAMIQKAEGKTQEALTTLYESERFYRYEEKVLTAKDPLFFNMAMLEEELGFNERAAAHYMMVEQDPDLTFKARVNLALFHERTGNPTLAIKLLKDVKASPEQKGLVTAKLAELEGVTREHEDGRFQERLPASAAYEYKVMENPKAYKLNSRYK